MAELKQNIVIIGATSYIAEHCARLWLTNQSVLLTLVARDEQKAQKIAADLRVRSPNSSITVLPHDDFSDPEAIRRVVDKLAYEKEIDIVLIAHGLLSDQVGCEQDLSLCREALTINGLSPVLFAEAFIGHMQRVNHGTVGLIGSVAGDRGRKSNYVYGAAKGLIARYAQGLQHRLAGRGVKVVLIKPGPTRTPMTAHLESQSSGFASVEKVAKLIVNGIKQGKSVVYAPPKWALIMMIIRNLPAFIFHRMNI